MSDDTVDSIVGSLAVADKFPELRTVTLHRGGLESLSARDAEALAALLKASGVTRVETWEDELSGVACVRAITLVRGLVSLDDLNVRLSPGSSVLLSHLSGLINLTSLTTCSAAPPALDFSLSVPGLIPQLRRLTMTTLCGWHDEGSNARWPWSSPLDGLPEIGRLTALEHLDLACTYGDVAAWISGLSRLTHLGCCIDLMDDDTDRIDLYAEASHHDFSPLAALPSLRSLELAGCAPQTFVALVGALPRLETLFVGRATLRDDSFEFAVPHAHLRRLSDEFTDFYGCYLDDELPRLTARGLLAAARAFPSLAEFYYECDLNDLAEVAELTGEPVPAAFLSWRGFMERDMERDLAAFLRRAVQRRV